MRLRLGAHLRAWDGMFGWKRRREAAATLAHVEHALRPGGVVLDIGCGMGYALDVLSADYGMIAVGCDVVPTANRLVSRFCRFDGWRLPFADQSVDVAMMIFVLHHAKDPAVLLREAARVARDSVLIVEDTPATLFDEQWGRMHIRSFNKRHGIPWYGEIRTAPEWSALFASCDLEIRASARLRRWERLPPVARTAFVLERREARALRAKTA